MYRPWGNFKWLLPRIDIAKWSLVGCVSTEDRCLEVFNILRRNKRVSESLFFRIEDPPSSSKASIEVKTDENLNTLRTCGVEAVRNVQLEAPASDYIDPFLDFLQTAGPNVVIDVSSLPKRFFFPIIKQSLAFDALKNLMITYSVPARYTGKELAGNIGHWKHLPLFGPTTLPQAYGVQRRKGIIVVGIGFQSLGLQTFLKDDHKDDDKWLLLPFPSGEHFNARNLDVIIQLRKSVSDSIPIDHINGRNVSQIFDLLHSRLKPSEQRVLFAPYGPKPMSVAMCLFASKNGSEVLYAQPRFYDPDYSSGISTTFGYCVKLRGNTLY